MTTPKERALDVAVKSAEEFGKNPRMTQTQQKQFEAMVTDCEGLRKQVDAERELRKAIEDATGSFSDDYEEGPYGVSNPRAGLYGAIKAQGFDIRSNPGPFIVAAESVYGRKTDLIATQANANPTRESGVYEKGRDERYVYAHIPQVPLSLDPPETSFQALVQTTRTLPAAADMQLAIDSSATKPVTDSVATLSTFESVWVATISNPQPIALFAQPELQTMLKNDMTQAARNSLDDLVLDAIIAASGALTLSQGGDLVPDFLYKARNDVIDAGFNPDLVVIGTAADEAIRLLKDDVSHYMFPPGDPLWGMTVVVSPQVAADKVYVLDTSTLSLRLSPLRFETNVWSYFESNRVVARLEGLAKPVVKQGAGILIGTLV